MSVKQGILALLSEGDMYGAQLKAEFEARTGGAWPLNIGQVYTTLTRLETAGLVTSLGEDDEGTVRYQLTAAGRQAATDWWQEPLDRSAAPRDELVIKMALAVTVPGVDVAAVVQTQRAATMRQLHQLTRTKQQTPADDLAAIFVLDNHIFAAEGEARWLDHIENKLSQLKGQNK